MSDVFDELVEVEEDFGTLYKELDKYIETNGEEKIAPPDSRISARDWTNAYLKMRNEIEYFKKIYIPALMKKYIDPVKSKIESYEKRQDAIKEMLAYFLDDIGEKNVVFPDLGTVCRTKGSDTILYPEDEEGLNNLVMKLKEEGSEFIVDNPRLDKKKIKEYYTTHKELPFEGIVVEKAEDSIRIIQKKAD